MNQDGVFIKTDTTKQELINRFKENPQCFSTNPEEKLFMLKSFKNILEMRNFYDVIVSLYRLENVNDCFNAIRCLQWLRKIFLALDLNPKIELNKPGADIISILETLEIEFKVNIQPTSSTVFISKKETAKNIPFLNYSLDCVILINYCENLIEFILNNSETDYSKVSNLVEIFNNKINCSIIESTTYSKNSDHEPQNVNEEEIFSQMQWSCLKCTYLNDWDLKICVICLNPKEFQSSNVIYI